MVAAHIIVGAWPTKKRLGRAQCHGQRDSLSHGRIKRLDTLNGNIRRSQARVVCDSTARAPETASLNRRRCDAAERARSSAPCS